MKVGKVFDKQAARKQVESITFTDNEAIVTLKAGWLSNGASSVRARNAHETRLFIDAAIKSDAPAAVTPAPVAAAAAKKAPAPKVETPVPAANDNLILVDTDWVRARTGGMIALPDTKQVRMTPRNIALLAMLAIAA